ncbi:UNVERIFIED_CONTAM: hypothetical protein FKN15_076837 [Acipenser sinensis]
MGLRKTRLFVLWMSLNLLAGKGRKAEEPIYANVTYNIENPSNQDVRKVDENQKNRMHDPDYQTNAVKKAAKKRSKPSTSSKCERKVIVKTQVNGTLDSKTLIPCQFDSSLLSQATQGNTAVVWTFINETTSQLQSLVEIGFSKPPTFWNARQGRIIPFAGLSLEAADASPVPDELLLA